MLVINKNTNNTLIVTLQEKVTLTTPYYLFVFTNDTTNEEVVFLQSNTSTHTDRYDQFLITERSTSLNASSGIIEFLPVGSWTYRIYEQASSSNLNPVNTGGLLETGQAKVIGTNETYSTYSGQDITYKVHERNQ
jgi:hypothetical protein